MASQSDVASQQPEIQEQGSGRGKKANSRDIWSTMDGRLAKVEVTVADVRDKFDKVEACFEDMDSRAEELKGEMQSALNETIDMLTQRNETLEAMMETMRKEFEELKGELTAWKTAIRNGVIAGVPKSRVEIPKPKEFKGIRAAKEVDKFLWEMEQCFQLVGMQDDASKVALLPCILLMSPYYDGGAGVMM
ncbi:uncharacterized protein LOC111315780 [Durio zibethinus]|uniref:Uncharacterized protein LOC111315780 n=1 Tax=Durio zibethinus TaxID=66656 RepID=A0A6P6B8J8_DURZI|nr:uncharacterized protein LOC111315780 [Durio zibethinus]XP_022773523.1 uncharacterized protein LOC111315780 [Durio zibethinus]